VVRAVFSIVVQVVRQLNRLAAGPSQERLAHPVSRDQLNKRTVPSLFREVMPKFQERVQGPSAAKRVQSTVLPVTHQQFTHFLTATMNITFLFNNMDVGLI